MYNSFYAICQQKNFLSYSFYIRVNRYDLAPIWEVLGYTPCLVIKRGQRDPKEILEEYEKKEAEKPKEKIKQQNEIQVGMSATKAKRGVRKKKDNY